MKICLWKNVCVADNLISTCPWRLFSAIIADYALNIDMEKELFLIIPGRPSAGNKSQRPKIRQTGLFEEGEQGRGAWCLSATATMCLPRELYQVQGSGELNIPPTHPSNRSLEFAKLTSLTGYYEQLARI